jgi:uncharacterized protein YcaQ
MQKNNVYCENCKHFKLDDVYSVKIKEECFHPYCFEPYEDFRIYDHKELNQYHDCKYYERKWWKIWVS